MTATDLARRQDDVRAVASWTILGRAQIDDRPPAGCSLTIRADGTWSARLALFTFAGQVDLMFFAADGGHFCGPAFVESSRADSSPLAMGTDLTGIGPLLVAVPADANLAIEAEDMVDGEVVDDGLAVDAR